MTEAFLQPLSDQASEDVVWLTGWETYDDPYWPRRIGLRPSKARHRRQRYSACGQMQKSTTGKFHGAASWKSFSCRVAFAHRDLWNVQPARLTLLRIGIDVGRAGHLAPLFGFVSDEFAEVGGRATKDHATKIGKPVLYLWIGESRVDLLIEPIDDLGGRSFGRADAVPVDGLEAWQKFAHGRHVRQNLRAGRSSYR